MGKRLSHRGYYGMRVVADRYQARIAHPPEAGLRWI